MSTKFKLLFENIEPDIDLLELQKSLPLNFQVAREDDGIYITIPSKQDEDERCQKLVDRELDRYFFLTWVNIRAEIVRRAYTISVTMKQTVYGPLPEGLGPQCWNYELPIQLRLWSLAFDTDNIVLKAIFFYQIIELAYPDGAGFQRYFDSTSPPASLTEAKLVRDWVTHAGEVRRASLKNYCAHLGIPELMFDPTNPEHTVILTRKLELLQIEAKNAISKSL